MSDTTARDRLAALLADDWNPERDPILTAMFRDYAQTILKAGWRPPARTVGTVEELDALPEGTIIRDSEGTVATRHSAEGGCYGHEILALPAIVLYEPKEGQ